MTETKTTQERDPQKHITGMAAWLPLEDGSSTQQLFNVDREYIRSFGARDFQGARESWLRRVHRRVLTWLAFGRFYVE